MWALWNSEKYNEVSHIAQGIRIGVNKEGEFIPRGRIEDVTYEDDSDSDDDSEDSSESLEESEDDYTSGSESEEKEESEEPWSHFDELEI